MITVVEVIFTFDAELEFRVMLEGSGRTLHKFLPLHKTESVAVVSRHACWSGIELCIPSSMGENRNLIGSDRDPYETGRPVRFLFANNPNDNDEMLIWELGGYWDTGTISYDRMDTITRTSVLHRST
jgi:hypothetical protein